MERINDSNKIVIWPDLPYWIYVSQETVDIIGLIEGKKWRDIPKIIYDKLDIFISQEELNDFLEVLYEAGVVFQGDSIGNIHVEQENCVIRYLTFNITDKCNLYCKHCYINSSNKKNTYMSLENAKKIIDAISPFMIEGCNIIVSGGEAILNPDCINIMKYFNSRGKGSITLVSNGTLFTNELIF